MRRRATVWIGLALAGCAPAGMDPRVEEDDFLDQSGWATFSVVELKIESTLRNLSYYEAIADPSFRLGYLNVPVGDPVGLITHFDNVFYYVQEGEASLAVDAETVSLASGTMVFVRGGTEHRIYDVVDELDVITVFPRGLSLPEDPELVAVDADSLRAARRPEQNTWAILFESSTAGVGVYSLPKGGGGDEGLTHAFPEFKIVMSGGGRFDVGNGGVEAQSGSIAYIEAGTPHQIRRVSEDMDILFIWKK